MLTRDYFTRVKGYFVKGALKEGGFEVIVSGHRKGTGSSRETAPQCERWSGIRIVIAASFAPIHERNNINLGQVMGDHAMLERLQEGEILPLSEFTKGYDPVTRLILENGGFCHSQKMDAGGIVLPSLSTKKKPMTMVEKIISKNSLEEEILRVMSPPVMPCSHQLMEDTVMSSQQLKFIIS